MRYRPLSKTYRCPCCGFDGLNAPAYARLDLGQLAVSTPPYVKDFGDPSYEICGCCGFEFGNDDDPGTALGISFEDYLREWSEGGCRWFDPKIRSGEWSLEEQLRDADLPWRLIPKRLP